MVNYVMIASAGRSGSTMLERIFDSAPNVTATGELHCLWRLPFSEITCSCGQPFEDDPFWNKVLERANIGPAELAELRELEDEVLRTGFIAAHKFSHMHMRQHPKVRRFLELQQELIHAIASVSGSDVVIDSSKAGPRAWVMSMLPNSTVWHLRRNPKDVIASWRSKKFDKGLGTNMKRMSRSAAAASWAKVEYLVGKLGQQVPTCEIAYGQLCREPRTVCESLIEQTFDRVEVKPNWIDENTFQPAQSYHSVNGNPDRFSKGPVSIRFAAANRKKLSRTDWYASRIIGSCLEVAFKQRS